METLLIQQNIITSPITLGDYGNAEYRQAQSFNPGSLVLITAVAWYFGASLGSPTGDVTYRIETNNAGSPSGTLIDANATKTFTPVENDWNKQTFATPFYVSAVTNWLKMNCDNQATDVSFRPYRHTSDVYFGGALKYWDGSAWGDYASDASFRIYYDDGTTVKVPIFMHHLKMMKG